MCHARLFHRFRLWSVWILALQLIAQTGCFSPGARARLVQEKEQLRLRCDRQGRDLRGCEGEIQSLRRRLASLAEFGPDRPADLFVPTKITIVSLSGGADYDGKPGDDGVTVYLRPMDRDGDVVKVPGQITIQLLDNSNLEVPRVLDVYRFDEPEQLRRAWHGKFGTNHYTLKCPFPPGVSLPKSGRLDVKATFTDYLTGRMIAAHAEVGFHKRPLAPGGNAASQD